MSGACVEGVVGASLRGSALGEIALGVSAGRLACEALRTGRPESITVRVRFGDGGSAVLKLWDRPGWRGALRRLTDTGPAHRDWRMLKLMERIGVRAPRAIARVRVRGAGARHTDGLYTEDLGRCEFAFEALKRAVGEGREAEARRLEDGMIETTARLLGAGVLDADNRATNYVVRENGELVRMDFEIARVVGSVERKPRLLGDTLGVLIGSHAFAVQPDSGRTEAFAGRLAGATGVSARGLAEARRCVEGMLEKQRKKVGIDTRVRLAW